VYTDENIVMGAESADFFFDCWYLKVITEFDTYQGASTISRKTLVDDSTSISWESVYNISPSWVNVVISYVLSVWSRVSCSM
jgi:hypothetical protein